MSTQNTGGVINLVSAPFGSISWVLNFSFRLKTGLQNKAPPMHYIVDSVIPLHTQADMFGHNPLGITWLEIENLGVDPLPNMLVEAPEAQFWATKEYWRVLEPETFTSSVLHTFLGQIAAGTNLVPGYDLCSWFCWTLNVSDQCTSCTLSPLFD